MPKLLGGSPRQKMEPSTVTDVVTFYDGSEMKTPRNWRAMLTGGYAGDEHTIVFKKFPPKTRLHPEPLTDKEKKEVLKGRSPVRHPTVEVVYSTNDDGYAYYNQVDNIVGLHPMYNQRYATPIFRLNGRIVGKEIPGTVKCAVTAMDTFARESLRLFDKEIVLDRTKTHLDTCLASASSSATFKMIDLPDVGKKKTA